jgi:hypothetical protein
MHHCRDPCCRTSTCIELKHKCIAIHAKSLQINTCSPKKCPTMCSNLAAMTHAAYTTPNTKPASALLVLNRIVPSTSRTLIQRSQSAPLGHCRIELLLISMDDMTAQYIQQNQWRKRTKMKWTTSQFSWQVPPAYV